jgi:mono/diheme cytochrome c family protein
MSRQWLLILPMLALPSTLPAQSADSLPRGVTAAMVEDGKKLYAGAGLCSACHGPDGKGIQGLGANLADTRWQHSDGSFDAIVRQILEGVSPEKSSTGVAMPARGGSQLTEAQVRAVAAYVWTLGRPRGK